MTQILTIANVPSGWHVRVSMQQFTYVVGGHPSSIWLLGIAPYSLRSGIAITTSKKVRLLAEIPCLPTTLSHQP